MERGLPTDLAVEGRRTGVMAFDHTAAENMTWAVGVFASKIPESPPIFQNDSGGTALAMRYTYLPWYATGENRAYKRTTATFTRLKPLDNFFPGRDSDGCARMGKGAWEVAYRYSFLDLNDDVTIGGYVRDHTLGLNWYLNAYTRLMFN